MVVEALLVDLACLVAGVELLPGGRGPVVLVTGRADPGVALLPTQMIRPRRVPVWPFELCLEISGLLVAAAVGLVAAFVCPASGRQGGRDPDRSLNRRRWMTNYQVLLPTVQFPVHLVEVVLLLAPRAAVVMLVLLVVLLPSPCTASFFLAAPVACTRLPSYCGHPCGPRPASARAG